MTLLRGLLEGSTILLSRLHLLILKSWHWKQILEQEVEQDQGIELEVAVVGALERFLRDLDHDLRNVESLVCNEFSFHLLGGWRGMQRLLVASLWLFEWELVNSLARTALDEIARQGFENLMSLHANVCFAVLEDL